MKGKYARTNNRLRKSPTSSVVDGPPIFMKTIAVPSLDRAEFDVTGRAVVAMPCLRTHATTPAGGFLEI